MNKYLKFALRTAMNVIDDYADQIDRASDRVSDMVDRGRKMVYHEEDHTVRNIISFAAGVGVGIGAGMLLAPSSGSELRQSIREKMQGSASEAA